LADWDFLLTDLGFEAVFSAFTGFATFDADFDRVSLLALFCLTDENFGLLWGLATLFCSAFECLVYSGLTFFFGDSDAG
jgi:hypothetical protein